MSGNALEVKIMEPGSMMLLPPHPSLCQECGRDHSPQLPHDKQSLHYQVKFQMEHGRPPTWEDAAAHCDPHTKAAWLEAVKTVMAQAGGKADE